MMSSYEDARQQYQKAQRLARRAYPFARKEMLVASAMRRLNWHARQRAAGKQTIYALKDALLKYWFERGYLTGLRRVTQNLLCRGCDGTGWRNYDIEDDDICWRCDGTGVWRSYELYEMTFQVAGRHEVYHVPVELAPYLAGVPAAAGEPIRGTITGGRDVSIRFAEFCYFVVWYGLPRRHRPRRLAEWQSVVRAWWRETRLYNWLSRQRWFLRKVWFNFVSLRRRLGRLWAMTGDQTPEPRVYDDDIPF